MASSGGGKTPTELRRSRCGFPSSCTECTEATDERRDSPGDVVVFSVVDTSFKDEAEADGQCVLRLESPPPTEGLPTFASVPERNSARISPGRRTPDRRCGATRLLTGWRMLPPSVRPPTTELVATCTANCGLWPRKTSFKACELNRGCVLGAEKPNVVVHGSVLRAGWTNSCGTCPSFSNIRAASLRHIVSVRTTTAGCSVRRLLGPRASGGSALRDRRGLKMPSPFFKDWSKFPTRKWP
mmetsp:Transcript_137178/g.293053  ORF Transcript_137178/g.293053 Transcript_137178/m.293053 type:complete len:241 (+) Transcript_137178:265-987(+)